MVSLTTSVWIKVESTRALGDVVLHVKQSFELAFRACINLHFYTPNVLL